MQMRLAGGGAINSGRQGVSELRNRPPLPTVGDVWVMRVERVWELCPGRRGTNEEKRAR